MAVIYQKNYLLPQLAEIDYLVVGKNAINTKQLPFRLNVKKVILDGSNSRWYANDWKMICEKENIAFHNVLEDGAFILAE